MDCLTDHLEIEDTTKSIEKEVQLIDVKSYPVKDVLEILLQDKSAKKVKKNIIWATDAYKGYGDNCNDTSQIIPQVFFTGKQIVLQPRTEKALEQQQERTRKKAEVFTPVWLCNMMNNYADEGWFGRKDVFNHENDDHTWTVIDDKIQFPEGKTWKDYVDSRRLEITCGEAPYLVSRYDAATGDYVLPLLRRAGILDRKLRVVNENTESQEEWDKWVERAFQSCYGYEWQGDSLLIARINLLMTFYDYYKGRWDSVPKIDLLKRIANIISWNIWQMDGQKDVVPFGKPYQGFRQMTLFDSFDEDNLQETETVPCKIYDWRRDNSLLFKDCKSRGKMSKKMFDFIVGNPPYQIVQNDRMLPVYDSFMDESYKLGDVVELITPGRFLFDNGQTKHEWNRKMLDDPHFKVLHYEPDCSKIFSGVDIKGGVAITLHDTSKTFGAIGTFVVYDEIRSSLIKIREHKEFKPLSDIVFTSCKYALSTIYADHPEYKKFVKSEGKHSQIDTNAFGKMPIFVEQCPEGEEKNYLKMYGRANNRRAYWYALRKYIVDSGNLDKYKVFLSKVNNTGAFGDTLSSPELGEPGTGSTQSYIAIGNFDSIKEAENLLKYLKGKFSRAMLSTLKVTQDNPPSVWANIPIQDFSSKSDIDWSKSIPEIDRQLYSKYHLSVEEMEFIENNVQEMN